MAEMIGAVHMRSGPVRRWVRLHRHRDGAAGEPYPLPAVVCRCGAVWDSSTGRWSGPYGT